MAIATNVLRVGLDVRQGRDEKFFEFPARSIMHPFEEGVDGKTGVSTGSARVDRGPQQAGDDEPPMERGRGIRGLGRDDGGAASNVEGARTGRDQAIVSPFPTRRLRALLRRFWRQGLG